MADLDQNVSALNKVQRWKEFVTGVYARLNGAILYGLSTSSTEVPLLCSTAGNIHVELQPSTEHIGYVSGHMTYPTAALAVTTSGAYSSGDNLGGVTSFTGGFRTTAAMTGILQSLHVFDKGTTACAGMDLFFLDTATTGTAPANDTACDFDDSDLTKIVAHVSVTSGDYHIFNDNSVAIKDNLGIPVRATTGTTLYMVAVNTSTGPVYGTTGDVNLKLGILAD